MKRFVALVLGLSLIVAACGDQQSEIRVGSATLQVSEVRADLDEGGYVVRDFVVIEATDDLDEAFLISPNHSRKDYFWDLWISHEDRPGVATSFLLSPEEARPLLELEVGDFFNVEYVYKTNPDSRTMLNGHKPYTGISIVVATP